MNDPPERRASRTASSRRRAPAVELHGLTKRYGRTAALDRVDLAVPVGSVFGFCPNGAGKTTTLRILGGLARPTAAAPGCSATTW